MAVNIVQKDDGTMVLIDGADGSATAPFVELIEFGRGATDKDITYIALRNASGTKIYIYPAAGGTTATVSATKP